MKEILQQYARYNVWANQRLLEALLKMPDELLQQELKSSFPSIHHTILHMWDAESIWWQRMKLQEHVIRPSEHFKGTTRDVVNALMHQEKLWAEWTSAATEAALDHVFQYYNNKREHFKQSIWQMLLHLTNHGSYHRGQLVTMMRQLGVEKIPQTDFALFTRK